MNKQKEPVRLREKILVHGNKSLYLDIYYNGKRTYEFLKLYLTNSNNPIYKDSNKKTLLFAQTIKAKRQIEIQNDTYGFSSQFKQDVNFIEYFKSLIEKKKAIFVSYDTWESTLKHLKKYCTIQTTFRDIDVNFVEGFKEYLQNVAKTKHNIPLSQNTKHNYFVKFKAAINKAYEDGIITENPGKRVKGIKSDETQREYLTLDELKKLAGTDCRYKILKRAFLFSCLTGMRWSDIQKLKWSEVKKYNESWRIIFRQKKTRSQEYLDISDQAKGYIGEQGDLEEIVFTGLKYSAWNNLQLQKWVMKAGINKDITFHCGRHTFAVLQLDMGTDIYTVSKLLGHADLETTLIYAKIFDQKKREAMNKIPDINI